MNYRRNEDKMMCWDPCRPLYNNVLATELTPAGMTEPVTLDEVKRKLRIMLSTTDFDDELTDLITQCRQMFEEVLGVSMMQRTVYAVLQNQIGNIELPYGGNIQTITDAKDIDGNTIDTANYKIRGQGFKFLETKYDWIALTYTVDPYVPDGLKEALLREIVWRFNHRGDEENDSNGLHAREALKYKRGSWLL